MTHINIYDLHKFTSSQDIVPQCLHRKTIIEPIRAVVSRNMGLGSSKDGNSRVSSMIRRSTTRLRGDRDPPNLTNQRENLSPIDGTAKPDDATLPPATNKVNTSSASLPSSLPSTNNTIITDNSSTLTTTPHHKTAISSDTPSSTVVDTMPSRKKSNQKKKAAKKGNRQSAYQNTTTNVDANSTNDDGHDIGVPGPSTTTPRPATPNQMDSLHATDDLDLDLIDFDTGEDFDFTTEALNRNTTPETRAMDLIRQATSPALMSQVRQVTFEELMAQVGKKGKGKLTAKPTPTSKSDDKKFTFEDLLAAVDPDGKGKITARPIPASSSDDKQLTFEELLAAVDPKGKGKIVAAPIPAREDKDVHIEDSPKKPVIYTEGMDVSDLLKEVEFTDRVLDVSGPLGDLSKALHDGTFKGDDHKSAEKLYSDMVERVKERFFSRDKQYIFVDRHCERNWIVTVRSLEGMFDISFFLSCGGGRGESG